MVHQSVLVPPQAVRLLSASSTLGVTGATTLSSTLGVAGDTTVTSGTVSTSSTSGALLVTGGLESVMTSLLEMILQLQD